MTNIKNIACYMTVDGEWQQANIIVKDANSALLTRIEPYYHLLYKLEDGSVYADIPLSLRNTAYYSDEYDWSFLNENDDYITFEEWILQHVSELEWHTYVEDRPFVEAFFEDLNKKEQERKAAIKLKEAEEALSLQALQDKANRIALASKLIIDNNTYPTMWKAFFDMIDKKWEGAKVIRGEIKQEYVKGSSYTSSDGMGSRSSGGHYKIQKNTIILNNGEKVVSSIIGSTITSEEEELNLIDHYKSSDYNNSNLMKDYDSDWGEFPKEFNYYINNNYEDIINYYKNNSGQYIPRFYRMSQLCDNWAQSISDSLGIEFDEWNYTQGKYTASYRNEYNQTIYFYVPVADAYNLAFIKQEIQSCLDKNTRIREAEAKKKADIAAKNKAKEERRAIKLASDLAKYAPYIEAAKKAGLTLIEDKDNLPKVKGIFFLKNYGSKKGVENPYINYIADDPNGFKYLKVISKPTLKKKV